MAEAGSDSAQPTLPFGCDDYYFCDLCIQQTGSDLEACGYCSDCVAYLCRKCYNTHVWPITTSHHVLLNQHKMPRNQQQTTQSRVYPGSSPIRRRKQVRQRVQKTTVLPKIQRSPTANQQAAPITVSRLKVIVTCTVLLVLTAYLGCFMYQPGASEFHANEELLEQYHADVKTLATHVMNIQLKSEDDKRAAYVSGCVITSADRLLVADRGNNKLKLVDVTVNKIVSHLKVSGSVWDITLLSSSQVAVTSFKNKSIYFVSVSNKLQLDHEVKLTGWPRGISIFNDNLVVSYISPLKVEFISRTGEVLQTVIAEDKGKELFVWPNYIAVSKGTHAIYISDYFKRSITKVSLAGKVQATYKDDELSRPRKLAIDKADALYVCDESPARIIRLSADLRESQTLLDKSDGLKQPMSVCFNEGTEALYVMDGGEAKVYKLNS